MVDKALSMTQEEQQTYWTSHVQRWQESNLKQQVYCKQAGISYNSFVYWKGVLSSKQQSNKAFVPITVTSNETASVSQEIQIKLSTGHVVCIPISMDPKQIATLIHFLGKPHA